MRSNHDGISKVSISNEKLNKRLYRLPTISLIFSFTPILLYISLLSIPNSLGHPGRFFADLFFGILFASFWGAAFCFVGLIIGIISFCLGIKQKSKTWLILSIVAVIAPFIWCSFLFVYYLQGGIFII